MKLISTIYTVLLAVLCWAHYPLAVFTPHGTSSGNMVFYFEFPHIFCASVLSCCFLLANLSKLNWSERYFKISAIALSFILISAFIGNSSFFKVFESASFVSVPLGVALALRDERNKKIAIYNLALLFVLNLLYCLFINKNIGIAGNQNWLAATLLSAAPFFFLVINKLPKNVMLILGVSVLLATAKVLWLCEARSIIPAILFYGLFLSYRHLSRKYNVLIYTGLFLCAISIFIFKADQITRIYNVDIRGPLAKDTISMSMSSPIFGHGPGNFQKAFPAFASDALKQRYNYSSIIEHPHNEFLHVMASSGSAVALCFLFMLLTLLSRKKDLVTNAAQFSLFILIVMALADKPLVVSPSAIIFLIAASFCLPQNSFREKDYSPQALKYAGLLVSLSIAYFFIISIKQKVNSEYYFWQAEVNRELFTHSRNTQKYIPEIMKFYGKSSELDPNNIKAAYAATSVSLQYFNDLEQSRTFLERALLLEPDYSDLHYQKGLLYLKSAQRFPPGKDKDEYLLSSQEEYLANVNASPWDLKRLVNMIRFYGNTGALEKCAEWIVKLRDTVREKSNIRYTTPGYYKQEEDLNKWQQAVLDKVYSPVPGQFKYNQNGDYLFPGFLAKTMNLKTYPFKNFNKIDFHFWRQQLTIWKVMQENKLKTTADLMAWVAKLKVSSEPLKWPLQTMESAQGNAMSLAALACCMNRLLGYESALLRDEEGSLVCILFTNNGKPFLWNCQSGLQTRSTLDDFHQSTAMKQQMGLANTALSYSLFIYPQACCFRNQVLADSVSQAKNIPIICVSPTLSYIRTLTKIGNRKLSLLTDFRALLDSEFVPAQKK
jgi:hypothetical protein